MDLYDLATCTLSPFIPTHFEHDSRINNIQSIYALFELLFNCKGKMCKAKQSIIKLNKYQYPNCQLKGDCSV